MAGPDDNSANVPGGRKIVALVLAVVGLLAILFYFPSGSTPGKTIDPLLAGLGEQSTDDLLDGLGSDLGGGRYSDGPIDLSGDGLGGGGLDGGDLGGLDLPGDLAGTPTIDGASQVGGGDPIATAIPVPAPGERRSVDAEALFAAQRAGDYGTLLSVARDSSYAEAGRVLSLTLASLVDAPEVLKEFYEVFEGRQEPFALRESAVYALLRRDPQSFPTYLTRVLDRPAVRSGQDQVSVRLIMLGFYSDRWLEGGAALDRVSAQVMSQARSGSKVALGVLSFALAADRPMEKTRSLFEGATDEPVVSANLVRFYREMVARGQSEYQAPLAALESAVGS